MGSDAARIRDMIARRSRGETLATIAEVHGVTRERVRQLIKKAGGPSAVVAQVAKSTARHRADQDLLEQVRAAMKAGTFEASKIARQIGSTEQEVMRVAKPSDRRKFVRHVVQPKKWSEATMLKAIETAAAGSSRITVMDYETARKAGRINGPTVTVVIHRFGSWVAAIGRLGLTAARVSGRGRSITKAKALSDLVSYFDRAGARVTAANYERWAGKNSAASLGTIRNIFGTWSEAKLQAQKAIARGTLPDHGSQEPRKGDYSSATQPMRNRMRSVKFDCGLEPPLLLNQLPDWIGHEENSGATIVDACTRYVTIDTDQAAPK